MILLVGEAEITAMVIGGAKGGEVNQLGGNLPRDFTTLGEEGAFNVKFSFGSVQKCLDLGQEGDYRVNLNNLAGEKAPFLRMPIDSQLLTGHLRLDLTNPLAKGNMTVFHGDKVASGLDKVVFGAIQRFVDEDKENKVVYVGYSSQHNNQLMSGLVRGKD
mmetsp:Transcript_6826/g.11518  ORF Transcript_6826/g.11518 Transcript_6826/m.11518 type:complete len:160 (+) Transcript_6826:380-859(+)